MLALCYCLPVSTETLGALWYSTLDKLKKVLTLTRYPCRMRSIPIADSRTTQTHVHPQPTLTEPTRSTGS